MNFVYVLYNLNNPDIESVYSNDLFDLFGSPDGLTKGFVYSIKKTDHKKLRWDWGMSGFKNIAMALYYEKYGVLDKFQTFYEKFKKGKIILKDFFSFPIKAVYQVKPKNNNTILFPAFVLNIHDIEKVDSRIFLTFTPDSYLIVDPDVWREFIKTRDNLENWSEMCEDSDLLKIILKAPSQAQHRIYPRATFDQMINLSKVNTLFYKKLDLSDRRIRERDILDNQIFWNMYQFFTKQCQVIGNAFFKYKGKTYEIKNVATNSLSKANACYKQELGTLQAIYSALSTIFKEKFIEIEFGRKTSISISQSKIVKRAFQILNFKHYDKFYENTDYDYIVDLNYLGINKIICLDLTVGLWNKGRDKTIDEYLEQWKHNIALMPNKNSEIITIFSFGINEDSNKFFRQQSNFESLEDFIFSIKEEDNFIIYDSRKVKIENEYSTIFMPFFGTKFDSELKNLIDSPRESLVYSSLYKLFSVLTVTRRT